MARIDTSAEYGKAQAAGAAIGGGLVTGVLGFVGFFLGLVFLVLGLLVGRRKEVVYLMASTAGQPASDGPSREPQSSTSIPRTNSRVDRPSLIEAWTEKIRREPVASGIAVFAALSLGIILAIQTSKAKPVGSQIRAISTASIVSSPNPPPVPAAVPTPSLYGEWQSEEERSEMDGSPTVTLALESPDTIQGWLDTEKPTLIVRCLEHKTAAYIVTGMASQPVEGAYERYPVELRFDNARPTRQWWSESTDSKALFATDSVALAKRLARTKQLHVRFTPFNASPAIVTFELKGLDQLLPKVARACGWQYARSSQ
jgi:hypothetical protein